MSKLRKHATIFYSTHILADVQRVSDTVAILNKGKLVALGPIEELLAGSEGVIYIVRLKGEVETALKSHGAVYDALVVGVPDERWGSAVAAVVQPRPGADPTIEELADHCRTKIAGYKVPRHLVVVDQIVRSPAGKPDYPWATKLATDELAVDTGA
jgi:acyl-CoA synthetase (AMP-forming)/AMP-acid ligase II